MIRWLKIGVTPTLLVTYKPPKPVNLSHLELPVSPKKVTMIILTVVLSLPRRDNHSRYLCLLAEIDHPHWFFNVEIVQDRTIVQISVGVAVHGSRRVSMHPLTSYTRRTVALLLDSFAGHERFLVVGDVGNWRDKRRQKKTVCGEYDLKFFNLKYKIGT